MLQSNSASHAAVIYALDFSAWKKPVVRQCFPQSRVVFVANAGDVPKGSVLAVWGMKPILGDMAVDIKILRLEDGFLRSVGLGADLIKPLSWVIDGRGIYYDATHPSDIEVLLQTTEFSEEILLRARQLRARVVSSGLTKYNDGKSVWQRPASVKRVILVPGQVESDASLQFGAPGIRQNLALLKAVKKANHDAYLLYKPHPDVLAGLRAMGVGETDASLCCDEVITDVPMGVLLPLVDEVHVLTSLTGFEALLRGKAVTCYGQPFYAGWGLTQDMLPLSCSFPSAFSRRTRKLTLDQLVAGSLLLYPSYFLRSSGELAMPEQIMDDLEIWRNRDGGGVSLWRKVCRVILRLVVGVR